MVRVAGLKRRQDAGIGQRSPDGMTPEEQLSEIAPVALDQSRRRTEVFNDEILPALSRNGIDLMRWNELSDVQQKEMSDFFERQIFPVVTPLAAGA